MKLSLMRFQCFVLEEETLHWIRRTETFIALISISGNRVELIQDLGKQLEIRKL